MLIEVVKEFSFEAAHRLDGYDGDCKNLHGHSYRLQVGVKSYFSPTLLKSEDVDVYDCMTLDFSELKRIVKKHVIDTHDHALLNDIYHMPTAEIMVMGIYRTLIDKFPADVTITFVRLWETATSYAELRGG